jgi:hypothetical protein
LPADIVSEDAACSSPLGHDLYAAEVVPEDVSAKSPPDVAAEEMEHHA